MRCPKTDKKLKIGFFKNLSTKYHTIIFTLKFIPSFKAFMRFVRCYLRVNLLKKNQIRFVEIFVTLACNARCDFVPMACLPKRKAI